MFGRRAIPLGRILGIPIGLDYSWFLIFLLLTWILAGNYYPAEFPSWPWSHYWLIGGLTAILFFVSVVLHELGHSVIAKLYKIPVRSITLFLFGGVAQITSEPRRALSDFWIAIAGPTVSFSLGGLCYLLAGVLPVGAPFLALLEYLGFINLALAVFNLMPGFPLDGGRVLRAVAWGITGNFRRATVIAANVGRGFAFLLIAFGVLQMLAGNFVNGMWLLLIGWFLDNAAVSQVHEQMVKNLLTGHRVSEAMHLHQDEVVVAPETPIQELVDRHVLGAGRRSFLIEQEGAVAGLLTLHDIRQVPRDQWSSTTARTVMIPRERMKTVSPDTELWSAMAEMDRDGVNQLPVLIDGHAAGVLSREDTISYLRTLQEIGT